MEALYNICAGEWERLCVLMQHNGGGVTVRLLYHHHIIQHYHYQGNCPLMTTSSLRGNTDQEIAIIHVVYIFFGQLGPLVKGL